MRREFSTFLVVLALSFLSFQAGANPQACKDFFAPETNATAHATAVDSSNPLIAKSKLPFGTYDFNAIKIEDIKPAFENALKEAQSRLNAIVNNKEAPTFANTIEALEAYDLPLERSQSLLGHYQNVKGNEAISELSKELEPRLAQLDNSVNFNRRLFERVDAVYKQADALKLTAEQRRLLAIVHGRFMNAALPEATKARIDQIDARLSVLATDFKDVATKDQARFTFTVTNEADLDGLPEQALKVAKQRAMDAGQANAWIFNFHEARGDLLISPNRALREAVWRKAGQIGDANRANLVEIAKLREERAKLFGDNTHADRILRARMAKNPQTVIDFLDKLAETYLPAAKKDIEEVEKFAGHPLEPWDLTYYSNKLRQERYGFNDDDVKPYLELGNVLKGFFFVANKLHGVTFVPRPDLPTWDPEVRAFEVKDRNGQHLALFYLDPFHRDGEKRAGAWMSDLQSAGTIDGQYRRPIVINVTNIKHPAKGEPALLTIDDVTTIFHEGGHALHSILTQAHYRAFAGTSVPWDFVELPSQFMENYVFEPQVMSIFARHHQTGAPIPHELVQKMLKAQTFQSGLAGLGQLRLATLDMAWHAQDLSGVEDAGDVEAFEHQNLKKYQILPSYGQLRGTTFTHIFSGGYSAGYYSYKWADVLASDAFEAFKDAGIFDLATATRFRTSILERGGTVNADQMYRDFRGRNPDPGALLRKEGLLPLRKS